MCGVTRLSVTLAVILFELTGSLDHVLPFSLAVLVAKWTADFIEPLSIYDLLTEMNHYPFLDNKTHPIFTSELGDITPAARSRRVIDISRSARIPASELRRKLAFLQAAGEIDGGLPIVRDGLLVGLLPAPDLEFALDKLSEQYGMVVGAQGAEDAGGDESEQTDILCLMSADDLRGWSDDEEDEDDGAKVADVTGYIDPVSKVPFPWSLDSVRLLGIYAIGSQLARMLLSLLLWRQPESHLGTAPWSLSWTLR